MISKFAIRNPQFTKGRLAPVSWAAMENGKREAAMQPTARPIKKQIQDLRERMQENVIHHVG